MVLTINALMAYAENNYFATPRIIDEEYRSRLQSFQVPAILNHFKTIEGKVFADIGCGDLPLAYCQDILGRPRIYYAIDINSEAIDSGVNGLRNCEVNTDNLVAIVGPYFDFSDIPDETIDCAFSNSLFSHLSLNSILICLKNLLPKMRPGSHYLSSMIILPKGVSSLEYNWNVQHGATSHSAKDPFHYEFAEFKVVVDHCTGFECIKCHEYGHPFQMLVEFSPKCYDPRFYA